MYLATPTFFVSKQSKQNEEMEAIKCQNLIQDIVFKDNLMNKLRNPIFFCKGAKKHRHIWIDQIIFYISKITLMMVTQRRNIG